MGLDCKGRSPAIGLLATFGLVMNGWPTPGLAATPAQYRQVPGATGNGSDPAPDYRSGSDGRGRGGVPSGAIVAGAAALLGGILFATRGGRGASKRGDQPADERDLLRDGPQLPTAYPATTFSARGFAKDGWPVVVDFEPQPNTRTELQVIFSKKKATSLVLDTNGVPRRHVQFATMPRTGFAEKARPATYLIQSWRIDGYGRPVAPVPVRVYGIGGGPRAVGSVAIEKLSFGPTSLAAGRVAAFDYHAKSPFNHTRAEVLRFSSRPDDATIRLTRVMEQDAQDVSVGDHGGSWNGADQGTGRRSSGLHRFQVRGWFTSGDKSWVGAIAASHVSVP